MTIVIRSDLKRRRPGGKAGETRLKLRMSQPCSGYRSPNPSSMPRYRSQRLDQAASSTCGGTCSRLPCADDRIIPVVVAKCGLYLKEHATEVEGAFRVSGSAKRMRDLQAIFDSGPRVSIALQGKLNAQYGKDIDWNALDFSPHDVATIFRRYTYGLLVLTGQVPHPST